MSETERDFFISDGLAQALVRESTRAYSSYSSFYELNEAAREFRRFMEDTLMGVFAALAYRDSASTVEGRFLTDHDANFTHEVIDFLREVTMLELPYESVLWKELALECAAAVDEGKISESWGGLEIKDHRIYLRAAPGVSPAPEKEERAHIVGGLNI